ncbi:hypothetical protein GlitD10_0289 [Gloeomargarita lithophora Alchichica-D10]|uniref:Uncharacterized protein n=2 Tax=Gloeomargarita TaxID=1188227 RepID=A0A1J0A9L9_9CYAN|nr:hypothetical protein GlitD10_0289 [Gloeomargarita lithophora Alchichica-D10]
MRSQENELERLRHQNQTNPSRSNARAIERQEDIISEIQDFMNTLRRIANYNLTPELNDGISLTIAPLYELMSFRDARRYWHELSEGKHTWSSVSQQLRRE